MTTKKLPYKVAIVSEQLSEEKAYWQAKLSGYKEKATFPGELLLARESSFTEEVVRYSFTKELCSQMLKLSNNSDLRLHVVLLAAVNVLLYKYTGIQDLVIGTSVYKPVTKGELINTVLALRSRLKPEVTFKELLLTIRQEIKEATFHQNFPLVYLPVLEDGSIQEELFNVAVILENIQDRGYLKPVQPAVSFSFAKEHESIVLSLYYNASLHTRATMEKVTSHLKQVVEQALSNVDSPIASLCLLTAEEKEQVLVAFNNTTLAYPKEKKIHQLVEEQAAKTPDAIALVVGDKRITYCQLNRKANQLAHYLNKCKGSQANDLVGILMPRSEWMVISILAILKAGAAYVPFDPAYPKERIGFIAEDARITTLLTTKELIDHLPAVDTNTLLLEEVVEAIDLEPDHTPDNATPNEVAYIIYTSGSTGKPKGTVIRHESTVNLLYWGKEAFNKEDLQGVLASTSICFDLSVFELFLPLATGGKVILADNLLHFTSLLFKGEVTLVNTVPSVLASFLKNNELPSSVKVVNLAGESLTRALVDQLREKLDVQVYNLYGPTETTTYSTFSLVEKEGVQPPSIGRPISNTQLYILDEGLQPVPVGVTGELYIGGVGLAKEYLHQSTLSKERFMENPFRKGERMYKTGDVGRWKVDGSIDYVGRLDQQVKIRGFRIELGEIENCLLQHPAVKEAAVVAKQKEKEEEKFLAAYIVSAQSRFSMADIKDYLQQHLPDYMMPAYFEQLEVLPLTTNGKIDKKTLTSRRITKWSSRPYVEPKNEIQRKIVAIWQQVLAVDEAIGLEHNFFELGGHSLNAARIINRIYQELNVEVPVSLLLDRPTVHAFATFIASESSATQISIAPQAQRASYPTSPAQKRVYVAHQFNETGIDNNVPFILRIEGALQPMRVEKVLNELVKRHESFRTSFEVVDHEIVQVIHPKVDFRLTYEEKEGVDVQQLIKEFVRPFDLSIAPLFRGVLVKRGEEDYLLMMDMHHIISDGASLEILINEFEYLYKGKELPAPALHYKDYAVWLSEYKQSQQQKQQETYWLEELKGPLSLLELPVDYDRLAQNRPYYDTLQLRIDGEFLRELQQVAATHQATLFMVLFSAYNILLYQYSRQTNIIVGIPVAGRPYTPLQSIVGMFVNLLAIRSELTDNKPFSVFLSQTKQKVLKAHENQLVQIDDLLNKLDLKRRGAQKQLYNTSFLFYNIGALTREIENIKLTRYEAEATLGLYDVAMEVVETTDALQVSVEYNAALFRRATMEQFMANYKSILERIVKNPEFSVGQAMPLTSNQLVY